MFITVTKQARFDVKKFALRLQYKVKTNQKNCPMIEFSQVGACVS